MNSLTPIYELGEYLTWARPEEIQLPKFQRGDIEHGLAEEDSAHFELSEPEDHIVTESD